MSYSDMWSYNLRCQLPAVAANPAAPANKAQLVAPKMQIVGGNAIFRKTVWNGVVPSHITHLDLSGNEFDDRYAPIHVPDHVKWLNFSDTNFTSWMIYAPDTLETLVCKGSSHSVCFPALPPALKILDVSGQMMQYLPPLPATLEVLILHRCFNLKNLPTLPSRLRVLDVRECTSLTSLPTDIPDSLTEIWVEGCPKLPKWIREHSWSYWDLPKDIRIQQEWDARQRQQKRCRDLRQEIVAEAYKPTRVEKWLEAGGFDFLDMMLG